MISLWTMFIFVRCFMVVFIVGRVQCAGTITNPQPVYVNLGEDVVLQCNTAAIKMKWLKTDDADVIASESDTINDSKYYTSTNSVGLYYRLHIRNVVTSDLTKYFCVISGSLDYYYLQIYLKVAPTGLSLYDVTDNKIRGTEEHRLTITCTATGGQPPPDITLTVGGITTSGVQSVSYMIPVLQRSHDKQPVRCQANNTALDTPMIKDAVLYLFLKPSLPILSEENPRTNETQLLTISCTSVGSRPVAVFYWKLNQAIVSTGFTQQNLSDPATETYNVTSTLTYKLDRSYNGKLITCGVNHSILTSSLQSTASLTVYYAPNVTVPDKTFTKHNDVRTVTCIPVGNPSIYTYYKWQHKSKYGELIRYLDGGDDGVLILPNVTESLRYQDGGEYICTVSNGIGDENGNIQQSASGVVQIQAQPVYTNEMTEQIMYGEIEKDFTIHNNVYSIPKYTSLVLYKNDIAVDRSKYSVTDVPAKVNITFHDVVVQHGGYRVTLKIKDLKETDFDTTYSLKCSNQFGASQSMFILKSASAPERPQNFTVISSTWSNVVVQWIAGFSNVDQIFRIQYRKLKTNDVWHTIYVGQDNQQSDILTYTFSNLQPNAIYELRMFSENVFNRSKYTDIETVGTCVTTTDEQNSVSKDLFGGVVGSLVIVIIALVIFLLKYNVFSRQTTKFKDRDKFQQSVKLPYQNMTDVSTYDEINTEDGRTKIKGEINEVGETLATDVYEMLGEKTKKDIYDDLHRQKDSTEKEYMNTKV